MICIFSSTDHPWSQIICYYSLLFFDFLFFFQKARSTVPERSKTLTSTVRSVVSPVFGAFDFLEFSDEGVSDVLVSDVAVSVIFVSVSVSVSSVSGTFVSGVSVSVSSVGSVSGFSVSTGSVSAGSVSGTSVSTGTGSDKESNVSGIFW